MALQFPAVQTALARKLTERLNKDIDGELTIGRVQLLPFKTLVVRDVVLTDDAPLATSFFEPRDTIARVRMATVSFSLKNLTGKKPVIIDRVVVRDGRLNLVGEALFVNNLKRVFHLPDPKPMEDNGEVLLVRRIEARNFRFTLANANGKKAPKGSQWINWADLDLTADAKAHDLHIANACVRGTVDECSAREKCGYRIRNARGNAVIHSGKVEIDHFTLVDDWSRIAIPYFSMTYENYKSFVNFLRDVHLDAQVSDSDVDGRTLGAFTGISLPELKAHISDTRATGTVDEMQIHNLKFREEGGISGSLSGRIEGLTRLDQSYVDARVRDLSFSTASVGRIVDAFAPGTGKTIARYAPGQAFVFNGTLTGPADDLTLNCGLSSGSGSVSGQVKAKDLLAKGLPSRLSGSVAVGNLDVGQLLGTDLVGPCSLRTRLHAVLDKKGVSLGIDSLYVDKARIHGYDYTNIAGAGTYANDAFNGRIVCSDPNLNFLFQGLVNLSSKTNNALYKFYFNLGYADLQALNLDTRGLSRASLAVNANFASLGKEDILGDIDIKDIRLENDKGLHDIGDISVSSYSSNGKNRVDFNSGFAEAKYSGSQPVTRLVAALKEAVLARNLSALGGKVAGEWPADDYHVSLRTGDTRDLLSFVMPGLYLADGTVLDLRIGEDGKLDGELKSQRVAFQDKYIKNVDLSLKEDGERLILDLDGDELSAAAKLLGNALRVTAEDNHIDLVYRFDNPGSVTSRGDLRLACDLARDEDNALTCQLQALPSDILIRGTEWTLDPADIRIRPSGIEIPHLLIHNRDQRMEIDGGIAKDRSDTLMLRLDNMDLDAVKAFVSGLPELAGNITGSARLISPLTKEELNLDAIFTADSLAISGYDAGTMLIAGEWDSDENQLDFRLEDAVGGRNTLVAEGRYQPSSREVRAKIKLDSLEAGYASGFLKEVFSRMEGKLSGEVAVAGTTDRLSVSSRGTRLDDGLLQVAFTNVPYYVSGPFHIDDHGITFDNMPVRDRYNGTGTVGGGITFDHLKDFAMATSIRVSGIEAFDTQDDGESPVYGKVSASGTVDIKGPFSSLLMDINARTEGGGDFHIPLRAGASLTKTDLLTFKQAEPEGWQDPYEEMLQHLSRKDKAKGGFGMRLRVNVRPEVQCELEIDKQSGNILTGRGNGTISLSFGPTNPFRINGDYSLTSGNFHFNAMNITSKNFTIDGGSSIQFNGDIMDSDLDITAKYVTKTSLATLITDSTATSYRRNVECGLKIYDKLRNPQLEFSIDIPDLDPSTKSLVESALSTEDKVQKQFVSLLVTNSFLPSDQSGVFNSSELLMSNMMEVMSGQLSNILQRLQIPLDLGLKYASGEGGTDLFDVAVSTRLFNDRVSVNGIIGNRQYSSDGSTQDVVGDLDVELKLDKAGAVRLSLFSHSADKYSNYLDYSQRNGVGIGYQREFNSFRTLFRRRTYARRQRQGQGQGQEPGAQARPEERRKTIIIQEDD